MHVFQNDKGVREGFLNWQMNPCKIHSDKVLLHSMCLYQLDRHMVSVSWTPGSILTHTQLPYSSSNDCSAFTKRETIIKIAIIKKVIYIINFLLVYYSAIYCTWPRTKLPMYIETWGKALTWEVLALCPEDKVPFFIQKFPTTLAFRIATFCKSGGAE